MSSRGWRGGGGKEVPPQQHLAHPAGHDDPDPAALGVQLVSKVLLDKPPASSDTERTASDSSERTQAQASRSRLPEEAADASRPVPETRRPGVGTRAAIWLGLLDEATPDAAAGSRSEQTDARTDDVANSHGGVLSGRLLRLFGKTAEERKELLLGLGITLNITLLFISVWMYLIGQDVAARRESGAGFADPIVAIAFCLAPLYGG